MPPGRPQIDSDGRIDPSEGHYIGKGIQALRFDPYSYQTNKGDAMTSKTEQRMTGRETAIGLAKLFGILAVAVFVVLFGFYAHMWGFTIGVVVVGIILWACVASGNEREKKAGVGLLSGWYADPWKRATYRYFDGKLWTHHTS